MTVVCKLMVSTAAVDGVLVQARGRNARWWVVSDGVKAERTVAGALLGSGVRGA